MLMLDFIGATLGRLVRWVGTSTLGRYLMAFLGLLTALVALFHYGEQRGRAAERRKQAARRAKAIEKQREIEDEVRNLSDDELLRRASKWVR